MNEPNNKKISKASVTDHLANERTLLAWVRTSIALMGFGL
jgi:putative membrane protein